MFAYTTISALLLSQVSADPFNGGRKLLATQQQQEAPKMRLGRDLQTVRMDDDEPDDDVRMDADGEPCGRDMLPVCTGTKEKPLVGNECDWGWIGDGGICVVWGTHTDADPGMMPMDGDEYSETAFAFDLESAPAPAPGPMSDTLGEFMDGYEYYDAEGPGPDSMGPIEFLEGDMSDDDAEEPMGDDMSMEPQPMPMPMPEPEPVEDTTATDTVDALPTGQAQAAETTTVVEPATTTTTATGGSDFSGELTYYGGAGEGGACTQTWVPPGFTTVALNAPQYEATNECGTCVSACFTNEELGEGERCFNAIIDNKCPECASGDLDLGEGGSGRWPVSWSKIPCPPSGGLQFSLQGSNASYAKVKAEGGPASVVAMTCNGFEGVGTPDSYFEFRDSSEGLGGGLTCDITFSNGETATGSF